MKYIIGITAFYHDSSVCLFKGNKLIFACEEERFSGIKHDSSFPKLGLEYIFKEYNLSKKDIECVCYYENPFLRLLRPKSFFKSVKTIFNVHNELKKISNKIHYTTHHGSHMTYSYLTSPFEDATIVSIDGVGETETLLIGKGDKDGIVAYHSVKYPHSMGLFYSAMTAFLGFKPNEGEYKVMGLASYGDPEIYYSRVKKLMSYDELGQIKCNMKYFTWNRSSNMMFNHKLELFLGMSCRLKDEPMTEDYINLAASVQKVYEDVFFDILQFASYLAPSDNLCVSGGCAYNGTANGKIIKNGLFKKVWIPPAPSDAGSSIGSCLDYLSKRGNIRLSPDPFLGPSYTNTEILKELKKTKNIQYTKHKKDEKLRITSESIYNGKVIGWFQDKIEFGARALGNRSILANPAMEGMKDRINSVIKKREGFRPFAPMVTFEDQNKYFESSDFIPYMNQVVKVKPEYQKKLIAVTHVDGTARVQSVTPHNPIYQLLKEYEKISGYPILLNTSFNIKDKTMVLTPYDAIKTFLDTNMDILVIGDYIVKKNK